YMRAIQHNEKWAALAPRDGRPQRWIGFIYRDLEMSEQAIPYYEEALKRDLAPNVAEEVRLELAECQIKRGEYASALKTLEQGPPRRGGLPKNPPPPPEAERALARPADATASVEQALTLSRDFGPALRLRASIHIDALAFDKAVPLLERAVKADPFDFTAHDR